MIQSKDELERWYSEADPWGYFNNPQDTMRKAPVRRVVTQNNHVFAVLYAFFKLECLKIKRHLNHFALRAYLYLKAIRVAYEELQVLKAA